MPDRKRNIEDRLSASEAWDRFAHENYGVSGDELSASAIIDEHERFFERLRRGATLNLPIAISKSFFIYNILRWNRGPFNKQMVNWEIYNKLHGLRNRRK